MSPARLLFSIVTPSFNQGRFIESTIRSVLEQDYPHVEYMILDGGSKDGTVDIIRRYEKRLAYWVSEPDRGQTDAINKGFARAKGDILMWLNSDDLLLPGSLSKVARIFRKHSDVSIVHGDAKVIDETGQGTGKAQSGPFSLESLITGRGPFMIQPASFFRKQVIRGIGPLDVSLRYAMDYQLWLLAGYRFRFHHLPEPLAAFRDHPGTKRSEVGTRYSEEGKRMMDLMFSMPDLPKSIRKLAPDAYRASMLGFLLGRNAAEDPDLTTQYFSRAWPDLPMDAETLEVMIRLRDFSRAGDGEIESAVAAVHRLHEELHRKYSLDPTPNPFWIRRNSSLMLLDLALQAWRLNRVRAARFLWNSAISRDIRALLQRRGFTLPVKFLLGPSVVRRLSRLKPWSAGPLSGK